MFFLVKSNLIERYSFVVFEKERKNFDIGNLIEIFFKKYGIEKEDIADKHITEERGDVILIHKDFSFDFPLSFYDLIPSFYNILLLKSKKRRIKEFSKFVIDFLGKETKKNDIIVKLYRYNFQKIEVPFFDNKTQRLRIFILDSSLEETKLLSFENGVLNPFFKKMVFLESIYPYLRKIILGSGGKNVFSI